MALSFTVHLADGQVPERCWVEVGSIQTEAEGGRVSALVDAEEHDEVLVIASGHLPGRFSASAMPETVHLERGRPVEVRLLEPLPEMPMGWKVSLGLTPQGRLELPADGPFVARTLDCSTLRDRLMGGTFIDPSHTEWTIHAPVVGAYRPTWSIMVPAEDPVVGGGQFARFTTESGRYEIVVDRVRGPSMLFETTLDASELAEFIERHR